MPDLSALRGLITGHDALVLILGAIIGAILTQWFNYFVAGPKLIIDGTGGGGAYSSLNVRNAPGFFGIRLPETILFGWRVFDQYEAGQVFDRMPARQCHARLIDSESGRVITQLWWQNGGQAVASVTLGPGESARLITFSRQGAEPGKYYVWKPAGDGMQAAPPPPPHGQLEGSRDFIIEISYADGRKNRRFPYKITKGFDGNYRYECQIGSAGL
jgi:hypothetical protein